MPEFDSAQALNEYLIQSENNLTQETVVNNYSIRVAFRPTDLLVYQELLGDVPDTTRVAALRKKYAQYYYFVLSLSAGSKEALHQFSDRPSRYSELLQTLSFRMGDHVMLTTSVNDTIPVGDFVMSQTYGLSKATDLLLAFNRDKIDRSEWIEFHLNEFGLGIGSQRFKFLRHSLESAPNINFRNLNSKI